MDARIATLMAALGLPTKLNRKDNLERQMIDAAEKFLREMDVLTEAKAQGPRRSTAGGLSL
jgi:hypothetical protein